MEANSTGGIMLNFQQIVADKLPDFEGRIAWPYLDTHKPPIVTVGIGCAIESLAEFVSLPFTISGIPATPDQITAAWYELLKMPGGMTAVHYQYDGCLILTDQGIETLIGRRLATFTIQLHTMFTDFANYPIGPKAGLLELIYGLGMGKDASVGATGLYAYHMLRAAVARSDWATAAKESKVNASDPAYDKRNAWVYDQFMSATQTSGSPTGSFDEGDPHDVEIPNI